jgi:hypothetical protein
VCKITLFVSIGQRKMLFSSLHFYHGYLFSPYAVENGKAFSTAQAVSFLAS